KDTNTDHLQLLDDVGKEKIFNLGYYTWVEQQGVSIEDFDARRDQEFWDQLHTMTPEWDKMVEEFNDQTGVTV
ncbi:MAG: pyridoxal-5'-phosphate-dependent protein subunit beta, partial [Actinomycetota bacterium]|nr:pyridoxal-5'-phosphate-dependent protein subunit beta [Actinomycetota bacterium]